jgi:hypothetical protein
MSASTVSNTVMTTELNVNNNFINEVDVLQLREKIVTTYTIDNSTKLISSFNTDKCIQHGLQFLLNTETTWSKKIIQFNEYLGIEMKKIRDKKKSDNKQAQLANGSNNVENNITVTSLVHDFPTYWKETEKNNQSWDKFEENDVKSFLSSLNSGTKVLPNVFTLQEIAPIQDLIVFTNKDITEYCDSKNDFCIDKFNFSYGDLRLLNIFVTPILVHLFNKLINSDENFDDEFTRNVMYLVYKGGDKENINNYRPLTVLPILVRVFESIVVRKYHDKVLNANNGMILRDMQKAILKENSGVWEHNFEMNYIINKAKEQNSNLAVFFIDLKNAYGNINYEQMYKIMKQYGFPTKFCDYFSKYYFRSTIDYCGKVYKWENGLFQGSSLSNILFLVFMDYMIRYLQYQLKNMFNTDIIQSKRSFLFVDDISLILQNEEKTNEILNYLEYGFSEHGMIINVKKTRVLYIDSSKKITYKIGNDVIEEVDEKFEYLGQPIFYGKEFEKMIKNKIQFALMGIDIFSCSNNMKINIFLYKIYPRIKRMIENNLAFYGDKVFDIIIQYMKWYLLKWGVNQTDFNTFVNESKNAIQHSIITKLAKSSNLNYLLNLINIKVTGSQGYQSEIATLTLKYKVDIVEGKKDLDEAKKKFKDLMFKNFIGKVYSHKNFVEWIH